MSKRPSSQAESQLAGPSAKKRLETEADGDSDDVEEGNDDTGSFIESSIVEATQHQRHEAEPVAGVITRISLCNFMCHNRLEVKLGSHVNFIVGRNGSGKSAIVTGLIVGLGGKAAATSRGSSVKSFIKNKKSSGWVEIVLNNKGKDSYKPEEYGDKIIIRRKLTAEGSSSYLIKGANGKLISSKRDELLHITNHLNIQIDNPVSVLNQDTSRNFLNTKSPADKFKFFMKATQLEQMNSDYDQVRRNKELTRQEILSKEQTLPKMRSEVKVWENKYRNLTAICDLKTKVKSLKNEMAWAEVAERERDLKPLEKHLKAEEAALPRFKQKVDETKAQKEQVEAHHGMLKEKLIECSKEVKDLEPLLQQRKKELQQAKEKLGPIMNQLKACDRELLSTRQECQQCQKRIEELKTIASHDYEADRRQREQQIEKLEGKLAELNDRKKVMEHDLEQYRSAVAKNKADAAQFENQLKGKNNKLRDIRFHVQTLKAAKNDRLQRFGPWMPEIVKGIQASKRQFHKVPKGPLGACFDLGDPKWALAIECCLKALVSSFVCHDHHDEQLLEGIFKESECPRTRRPTIITCRFSERVHNVSKNKVQSDRYPTFLDVIKSDDPVIINTLIDQRAVENVLLIEDSNEAREVMMRAPPQNARECFTIGGDQAFCLPTFRYYSSDKTTVKFLMADVQDQINILEHDEKLLAGEVKAIERQRDGCQQEITKNQHEEKKCLTQLNKIAENLSRVTFEINELKNVEDPAPVDVTTLEEEVVAYEAKIQELQTKRLTILDEKKRGDENLSAVQDSYKQVEKDIRERSDSGIPLRDEISKAQVDVDNAQSSLKHYTAKLKEQERKIQELKKNVEKHKEYLEEDKKKAQQICPRIDTQRTVNNIENEIAQIKRRIEEEEEQQGNEEEITETYHRKKEKLENVKREVGQLRNYVEKLDEVMEKREVAYQKMRKNIASRTKYFFLVQMFHRSFSGKMNFDFDKQTLDILVKTAQESNTKNGTVGEAKDLKSLSGGERSFSTVCFILSLWEAMESPFRCLDEFDVFMDMVNRRISMDMMMETADMHKNMQFIFLTPQDMSTVRNINNVRIFRMPDPERTENQETLPFSS